LSADSAMIYSF